MHPGNRDYRTRTSRFLIYSNLWLSLNLWDDCFRNGKYSRRFRDGSRFLSFILLRYLNSYQKSKIFIPQFRGSRKEYSPRSARRLRLREPLLRSSLLPLTAERFASNQSSTNSRLPNITPRVKCTTRRINTSALTRRSVAVVSCSRSFSESPRRITVPSSRFLAAPCPPRIAL